MSKARFLRAVLAVRVQAIRIVKTISRDTCVDNNRICDIFGVLALKPKRIGTPCWIDSAGREMEAIGKLGAIGMYTHRHPCSLIAIGTAFNNSYSDNEVGHVCSCFRCRCNNRRE